MLNDRCPDKIQFSEMPTDGFEHQGMLKRSLPRTSRNAQTIAAHTKFSFSEMPTDGFGPGWSLAKNMFQIWTQEGYPWFKFGPKHICLCPRVSQFGPERVFLVPKHVLFVPEGVPIWSRACFFCARGCPNLVPRVSLFVPKTRLKEGHRLSVEVPLQGR